MSGRGFWALTDQGVVSLGTFFVGITLARNLPPEHYGAYAIIFGVLLFLDVIHTAIVQFPLTNKGASLSGEQLGVVSAAMLLWTAVLAIPLMVLVGGIALAVSDPRYVPLVVLALLAWQLQETVRQSLATHLRHRDMLIGDGIKYLGWAASVWILVWAGQVSIGTVFAALWLTSTAALLIQCRQAQVRFDRDLQFASMAREAWQVGRFVLVTYALGAALFYIFPWSLSIIHGLEATARFQALLLVLGVVNPIMYGMISILIPVVARARQSSSVQAAYRAGLSYGALGGLVILPYLLVLFAAPALVLSLFFGSGSPYADQTQELRVLSAVFMLHYTTIVLQSVLNGIRRVLPAAIAQMSATFVAVIVGIPLLMHWNVLGAGIAWLASLLVLLIVQMLYLWLPGVMPWARTWSSSVSTDPATQQSG